MKAKRRHELETNDLARWLAGVFARYKDWVPYIAAGLSALIVVSLVVSLVAGRSNRLRLRAWESFFLARSAEDLERVVTQYKGTDAALWAELELADYLCSSAQGKLLTEREAAAEQLRQAIKHYQRILNSPDATPLMRQRAALPQAKCWEILGERRKALERYKQITQEYFATPIGEEAKLLAQQLESGEAADFYKWFAEYKPPKLPELAESKIESTPALPELPVQQPQTRPDTDQQPVQIPELPPEMEQPGAQSGQSARSKEQPIEQKPADTQPSAKNKPASSRSREAKLDAKEQLSAPASEQAGRTTSQTFKNSETEKGPSNTSQQQDTKRKHSADKADPDETK